MKPRRSLLLLPLVIAVVAVMAAAPTAGADDHGSLPSSDYDLAELTLKQATYDAGSGDIVTVSPFNSKILLPPMQAAPVSGRYLEVELSPTAQVDVIATWYESDGSYHTSDLERLGAGANKVALFDLSSMNTTDGPVRIRVYETTGETAVHRITLFEEGPAGPPNIIVIVVDDARYDEFELGFYRSVPGSTSVLETEFVDSGVEFKNYINTTPLCCPSRASYLTGQYAHNHNIWNNNYDESDPVGFGGIRRFYEDDRDLTSLGTWMQAAGYDTGLVGKYLNGYPDRQGMATVHGIGEDYVPRGWDEWYSSFLHDDTTHAPIDFSYEHFRFNENGSVVTYGPGAYLTDVEADLAVDFIDRNAGGSDPFFLYMAPYAPHGPTTARPDHYKIHKDLRVRPNPYPAPACNEGAPDAEDPDDSDKPQYIQDTVWDYGNCWGIGWLERLDMTLALDEMLGDIVAELQQEGVYDDTWIFLTSDNGQLRGEHGIGGKSAPYEESIVVPLYVRGPGVPAGVQRPHLVANIDIAPTVLDLAGASPTSGSPAIDGESIVGPVTGAVTESDWRDGILIEMLSPGVSPNREHITPRYGGVRSDQHVYIKYETTEREFYDLVNDPFQLTSYWPTAPSGLKSEHQELLQGLDNCAGSACADAARIDTGSPPTASFTVSCSGLECSFDASASSDPDGTIETYDWDFGDGTIAEGETTTHTYAAGGDYTVTLMVTDNDDLTDTETKTASPSSSGAVHEHGIDMLVNETQSTAIAKVWVRDDGGGLVEGATVTGTWSEDGQDLGTFTAVSNSAGKAKLVVGVDDPQGGENLEFCVTDITHPTLAYDAGSNVEGCDTILWPGGGASGTIHEDGIDMLTKQDNDNANAKVWVRNDSDALVEGATVTGTWTSNGTGLGSFSGVSAANGKAKIVVDLPGAQSGDVLEFCVTAMTHPSYTHDAGSNAETCDSITWS